MPSNYEIFLERKEYLGEDFRDLKEMNSPKDLVKLSCSIVSQIAKDLNLKSSGLIAYSDDIMISTGLSLFDLKANQLGNLKFVKKSSKIMMVTVKSKDNYYSVPLEISRIESEVKEDSVDLWKRITSPKEDYFNLGKSSYKVLMDSIIYSPDLSKDIDEELEQYSLRNQEDYKQYFKERYSN